MTSVLPVIFAVIGIGRLLRESLDAHNSICPKRAISLIGWDRQWPLDYITG